MEENKKKEQKKEEKEKEIENNINKRCSLKEHSEIEAIIYYPECNISMCNKCKNHHSELFKNHHVYQINEESKNIFTGICTKNSHSSPLKYYCKDHNELCCMECICKVEEKGIGQHKDCNVCPISKIKNQKKEKLNGNINYLKDLSKNLQESIKQIKQIFEENNKSKEKLKKEVQKIFTKIRNIINEREDNIFLAIDKKYEELYFKESFVNEIEQLPKSVNDALEKSEIKENEWNDDVKLNYIINNCINIENRIKEINLINEKINKCKSNINIKIEIDSQEDKINILTQTIKTLGEIKENKIILKREEERNNT